MLNSNRNKFLGGSEQVSIFRFKGQFMVRSSGVT